MTAKAIYALSISKVPFQLIILSLHKTSAWHKSVNEGQIPLMETQTWDYIKDSNTIVSYALKNKGEKGLSLLPEDPVLDAEMHLKIDDFSELIVPLH